MGQTFTVLFVGDVIGQPGTRAVFTHLKKLTKSTGADFVVVNGENASDGFGMTPEVVATIFDAGADVITSGNHIWQKRELYSLLDSEPRLLRPANYPPGVPGHGFCIVERKGVRIAVMNLQGRVRMVRSDCPFRKATELLRKNKAAVTLIDFHAEAADEKEALGMYLDGKVAAIVGTHTHIQTADARVLPKGTAYMTDLGSTGPGSSVIGFEPEISIRRSLTQLPLRNEVSSTPAILHGAVVTVDPSTGLATEISPVREESVV